MTVEERIRNIFVDLHAGMLTTPDGRVKDDVLRSLLELEMDAVRSDTMADADKRVKELEAALDAILDSHIEGVHFSASDYVSKSAIALARKVMRKAK